MKTLRALALVLAASTLPACSSESIPPGETPFIEELAGHWASATCESAGPAGFLKRDFVISTDDYKVTVNVFGDDACSVPLMTVEVTGPIEVIGESSAVEGAYEVNYVMTKRTITPRAAMVADGLNGAMCGDMTTWAVDVAGDVTVTGCPAFGVEPNPPCDKEMDLNKIDAEGLWFGDRSQSLCSARPTALGPLPVVAQ